MVVCIGNWINKHKYPYACNFIYSFSLVVPLGCGMFLFDLCILFVCWHGICIVITFPMLCDSMDATEY